MTITTFISINFDTPVRKKTAQASFVSFSWRSGKVWSFAHPRPEHFLLPHLLIFLGAESLEENRFFLFPPWTGLLKLLADSELRGHSLIVAEVSALYWIAAGDSYRPLNIPKRSLIVLELSMKMWRRIRYAIISKISNIKYVMFLGHVVWKGSHIVHNIKKWSWQTRHLLPNFKKWNLRNFQCMIVKEYW